jgi:hypothetical protein
MLLLFATDGEAEPSSSVAGGSRVAVLLPPMMLDITISGHSLPAIAHERADPYFIANEVC